MAKPYTIETPELQLAVKMQQRVEILLKHVSSTCGRSGEEESANVRLETLPVSTSAVSGTPSEVNLVSGISGGVSMVSGAIPAEANMASGRLMQVSFASGIATEANNRGCVRSD